MEKLRATITQYKRWEALTLYIDRMEGHLESDFSLAVENAKALLESIGKEICSAKGQEVAKKEDFHHLMKSAFTVLGHGASDAVTQISRSLSNMAKEIGTLRNQISPTSHGRTQEELRERNNGFDMLSREFLIDSTLVIAVFLIRAFEERKDATAIAEDVESITPKLEYFESDPFNIIWDDVYGEFVMGEYSYTASEILFNVDYQAYEIEYRAFLEAEPELDAEETE